MRRPAAATASGVDIRTSTAVDEVLVDEGRATGVRTASGERIDADAVVVNADLAAAEPKLLGSESRSDYANSRYSTSSITFLWALDRRFDQLQHHNVFLSEDGDMDENMADRAFKIYRTTIENKSNVYLASIDHRNTIDRQSNTNPTSIETI